ncbi:hypothetical protein B0T09DRAFT_260166 [Sordaria sp. MPI-SDFR-AT-0083]|nr:hypothetical protein B0T09DRAFT_260166 [Sordaria sp. MPI-SDFR-AT-0083]
MCRFGYTYKYCLNGEQCRSNRGYKSCNGGLYPGEGYFERAERCIRSDWTYDQYLDGRTSDEYCPTCQAVGERSSDR